MNLPSDKTAPHRLRRGVVIAVGALALLLLLPAGQAFAHSDPTQAQYSDSTQATPGGGHQGASASATPAAPAAKASSGLEKSVVGLPFTGFDLVALAIVAVALTSVGLALRRLTVKSSRVS